VLLVTLAAVVPAALADVPLHTLRLSALPVFLLVLTVPAVDGLSARRLGRACLTGLAGGALLQAALFQHGYRVLGPLRREAFEAEYPGVFATAVAQPRRPIYLTDPTYIQGFWLGALAGLEPSELVHLEEDLPSPALAVGLYRDPRPGDRMLARHGMLAAWSR
jgi:hypothetical protein